MGAGQVRVGQSRNLGRKFAYSVVCSGNFLKK